MAAMGIPDYRLPRFMLENVGNISKRLGIEIRYNTQVGKDITISQMFEQGYKAIFIGVGAQTNTPMGVEGEDKGYKGFIPGVYYLLEINQGRDPYPKGKGWWWSVVEMWRSTASDPPSASANRT